LTLLLCYGTVIVPVINPVKMINPMMKHITGLIFAAFLLGSSWARAQPGFSADVQVTSDTQAIDWGLPVFAFDMNDWSNSSTTNVGGVDFSGDALGSQLTMTGFSKPVAGESTSSTLTGNLGDIVSVAYSARGGSAIFALNGLKTGQTYELQLFAGSAGGVDSEEVSDGTWSGSISFGDGANGVDSIIDTFVAGGETVTFDMATPDGGTAYIDAIDLREAAVSDADPPADPSPEPSTLALLLAGVVLMLGLAKYRGTAVLSR
jgi:hypothetical protein